MKCFYAIPADSARGARKRSEAYAASLEALSSGTVALADDLRAFVEAAGAAILKIDDADWLATQQQLKRAGAGELAGDLYWSSKAARHAQTALEGARDENLPARTLASWLANQLRRDRVIVLLTG